MKSTDRAISRREFAGSLAAVAGAPAQRPGQLRAGAASSNITPALGVLLDGTIMQIGPATHVHDELHARSIVLDDGSTRLAIVVCDATMISEEIFDRAKEMVHRHAGLAPDRMLMSATHTHSAPRSIGVGQGPLDTQYAQLLSRRIADCVRRAINNLAPAKAGWSVLPVPEYVFNRRWFVKPGTIPPNPFGGQDRVRMNPPRGSDDLVRPAGPVDPDVSVLSVQHDDGRPLALLANYGMHYAGGFVSGHISADYFGYFSRRLRQLLDADDVDSDFVAIMSNGTSGNVSNGLDFRRKPPQRPPYARMREVGVSIAGGIAKIYGNIQHHDRLPLAMRETSIELATRRPDKARLAWANDLWSKAQGAPRFTRPEIYARENLLLNRYPPSVTLKLQALRIGELGIAAIPCEVFAETGLAIKRQSPQKPTFVIEIANGYAGYLPTPQQHELGGYETWPARSSFLEVEAEPKIRSATLRLLDFLSS